MRNSEFEQVLPGEYKLGQALGGAGVLGCVFELSDKRLDSDRPAKRVVRFLSIENASTPWCKPLLERLRKLTSVGLPYVSVPLESGVRGDVFYIIGDRYDDRLSDKLPENTGWDVVEANRLFKQVLTGLAELHNRGIAHGDVRTKKVYLSKAGTGRTTVWLADAAIGPMTWWSGGKLRDPDARRHYAPEWKGKTSEPSTKADLYALGLMACELFLGRKSGDAIASAVGDTKRSVIKRDLRRAKVPRCTRKLIDALLTEDPQERPRDAMEALSIWERLERRDHWLMPVAVAVAVAALFLMIVMVRARSTANKLVETEGQVADLRDEHSELQQAHDFLLKQSERNASEAQKKIAAQAEEIRHLRERPSGEASAAEPKTAVPESVKTSWLSFLKGSRGATTDKTLLNLIGRAEKVEPSCATYLREVRALYNLPALAAWLKYDKDLSKHVEEYIYAPWNSGAKADVESRHADLEQAKAIWKNWASPASGMTWDNIKAQTEDTSKFNERVRKVLGQWLTRVKGRSPTAWTIRLKKGQCSSGFTRKRIVTVYSGDTSTEEEPHTWDSETSHDYAVSPKGRDIKFEWHPHDLFGLVLEEDTRSPVHDEDIIYTNHPDNAPFRGPLAVWLANYEGITKSKIGSLTFEILDCPGPPREVFGKTAK